MTKGYATVAETDDERCIALTLMTRWKRKNKSDQRCPFRGTYLVQGKLFCRHHAENEAVAICIELGHMKRVVLPRPNGSRVPTIGEEAR